MRSSDAPGARVPESGPACGDTKKKEIQYRNGGRKWRPEGDPEAVNVHDFPDPELGKAIPCGVYDLTANAGWVSVGHDTAAFAVEAAGGGR